MPGDADIASIAALLADPTRAAMMLVLSDGRAFTASELAKSARVAPSTASEHLGRLVDSELLAVVKQGRNRFYHLADPTIVEIMEDLARLAPQVKTRTLSASEHAKALHRARMCYNHLAGTLGVLLTEALVERQILHVADAGYVVEEEGITWLHTFGIASGPLEKTGTAFCPLAHRLERAQAPCRWSLWCRAGWSSFRATVARTPPFQSRRSPDHGWKNGNGAGVRAPFLRGGGISLKEASG